MAKTPNSLVTPQEVRSVTAIVTGAATALNALTNCVKLCDAGANDSLLKGLSASPRATVTATRLCLFISPDNGTTGYLIESALMAAQTIANTTEVTPTYFTRITSIACKRLASTDSLWVGAAVALAGGIVFNGEIEDF